MRREPANDWFDDAESIAMREKHSRKNRKPDNKDEPQKRVCDVAF
jgi:hypothetical protein